MFNLFFHAKLLFFFLFHRLNILCTMIILSIYFNLNFVDIYFLEKI
jgi:hypothetical protein